MLFSSLLDVSSKYCIVEMGGRVFRVEALLVSMLIICFRASMAEIEGSVVDYGAVGDGMTDDSNAFLKAWEDLCNSADDSPTLHVPAGMTFLLQPLAFKGPCKSTHFHFRVSGTIRAPGGIWKPRQPDFWISFSQVSGLVIHGDGLIDGRGHPWWTLSPNSNSKSKPKALHLHACNNLQLRGLTFADSPSGHISVNECDGVIISNLNIRAPPDSPNTDGIDISRTTNIQIYDSSIGTGDDCIAINGGSSFINISDIDCGPGHGISIGSLGFSGHDTVEEVYVKNCNFTGTQNGVRIKTWEGGSGYARKITFENINLVECHNPIIVNQHYVDKHKGLNGDGVKVSDVTYRNVQGSSTSKIAIKFDCCSKGCTNLRTEHVSITSTIPGKDISASCNNAQGASTSTIPHIPW